MCFMTRKYLVLNFKLPLHLKGPIVYQSVKLWIFCDTSGEVVDISHLQIQNNLIPGCWEDLLHYLSVVQWNWVFMFHTQTCKKSSSVALCKTSQSYSKLCFPIRWIQSHIVLSLTLPFISISKCDPSRASLMDLKGAEVNTNWYSVLPAGSIVFLFVFFGIRVWTVCQGNAFN